MREVGWRLEGAWMGVQVTHIGQVDVDLSLDSCGRDEGCSVDSSDVSGYQLYRIV